MCAITNTIHRPYPLRRQRKHEMTTFLRSTVAIVVIATIVGAGTIRADDDDIVDYREHIMKTMGEQSAAISMILQLKAPTDNLGTHLRILAITTSTALRAFEPKVVGGHSKADIWGNW